MKHSIIGLIVRDQAAKAVSVVEKVLGTKLRTVITEQKRVVARDAYGTLEECFGADDAPEFMETGDNAYQAFFQNALKKFGVNGPQDFQDDNSKQQFFNYLDQNWKAQDAVQAPSVLPAGTVEAGTQTQLPNQAMQPTPPNPPIAINPNQPPAQTQAPVQGQVPSTQVTAGAPGNQMTQPVNQNGTTAPNLANVQQPAPGAAQTNPMGGQGQDPSLAPSQPTDGSEEPLIGDDEQMDGSEFGGDGDEDPDLEIGDEDADVNGQPDLSDDPEDEQGMGQDDEFDDEQVVGQDDGSEDEDSDSDFDDEDAYTVDHNDFMPKDGSEDDDSDDMEDDGSEDVGPEAGGDEPVAGDDQGDDEGDTDPDPDLDIDGGDDTADDDGDDEDEVPAKPAKKAFGEALKPSDYAGKTRKQASKKVVRSSGKKEAKSALKENADDYGFGQDNADDQVYIAERANFFKKAKQALRTSVTDPAQRKLQTASINDGAKKHGYVQKELDKIKIARNAMLKQLHKQRHAIKADGSKDGAQKEAALKQLAQMAKTNRTHFKQQALQVKSLHMGTPDKPEAPKAAAPKPAQPAQSAPPVQESAKPVRRSKNSTKKVK